MAAVSMRRMIALLGALSLLCGQVGIAAAKPKKAPAAPGFVTVDSPVAGASIEIDGVAMGTTPAPPISIAAGSHAIKVSKRGFLPVLDVVMVKSNEETKFF